MPKILTKTFLFASAEGWNVGFENDTHSSEYVGSLAQISGGSLQAHYSSTDTSTTAKNFYLTCELSPANFGIPVGATIQSIRFLSASTKYNEGQPANSLTIGRVDVYKPSDGSTVSLYGSSRTVNSAVFESDFVTLGPGASVDGSNLGSYQVVGASFAKVRIKSTVTSFPGDAKSYGFLFDDISFEISYIPPPRVSNTHLITHPRQIAAGGVSTGFTRTSPYSIQSITHAVSGSGSFPPTLQGRYLAIIDDSYSSPEFTVEGSQFSSIDPFDDMQPYRVNYQNTQMVATVRDGTSKAIYTFDSLPIGEYDIWATWNSWERAGSSDNAATNTPYAIHDGASLLQTYLIDQSEPPVPNPEFPETVYPYDLNANGTKWRKIGSHLIVNGEMVVTITNTGDGPVFADAVRVSSAGDLCLGESVYTDEFDDGVIGGEWDISHGTWSESSGVFSQTGTASSDKKAWNWNYEWSPTELEIVAKVRVNSWTDGDGLSRAGVSLNINELGLGYNLIFEGGIGGSFTGKNKLVFLDDGVNYGTSYVFPWTIGAWYWLRLKRSGNYLYGKVWADGSSEPGTYPYSQQITPLFSDRDYGYPGLNSGNNSTKVSFDSVTITPALSFTGCSQLQTTRQISADTLNNHPPIVGDASLLHHKTVAGAGGSLGQEFRGSTATPSELIHFTFEETGLSVIDWSGQGRTGTLVNLNPSDARFIPGSIQFGTTGQVVFPEVILERPATICFSWMSVNRSGLKRTVCMRDGTHGFYLDSDDKFTWTDNGITIKSATPVSVYDRHEVALTVSATGDAVMYLDGVPSATTTGALQTYLSLNSLGTTVDASTGIIYDFSVFSEELSADDIAGIAAGSSRPGGLNHVGVVVQGSGERLMPVYQTDTSINRRPLISANTTNDIPTSAAVSEAVLTHTLTATGNSTIPVYAAEASCDVTHACNSESRGQLYRPVSLFVRATNNSEWLNRMTLAVNGDNHVNKTQPLTTHGHDRVSGLTSIPFHTLSVSDPQINMMRLVIPLVNYPLIKGEMSCFIRGGSTNEIRLGAVSPFVSHGNGLSIANTPMFVKVADAKTAQIAMTIKGPLESSHTAPLFLQAPRGQIGSLNLFVGTLPAPSAIGVCPLYTGCDVAPRGVIPFTLTGWNSPVSSPMNLYMHGSDEGGTSKILNLWMRGGNSRIHNMAPLVVFNAPPKTSFVELYIKGDGKYAGRIPYSKELGLFIQRGGQAGMYLSIENHDVEGVTPLMIHGSPFESNYIPMVIVGDGGVITSEVTLAIPNVYEPTGVTSTTALSIPATTGSQPGQLPLYIGGWRKI